MKKIIISIIIAAIFIAGLGLLASNPIVNSKVDIPSHYLKAIESQSKGVYSNRLPLVPVYVSVDSISDSKVYYTIYYFPLGTVGMSYTEGDGYNIEKPLTKQ